MGTTVVVDLGLSNLSSVKHGLARVGARAVASSDAAAVEEANAVVLPGVGSFADGMAALRHRGLAGPIIEHASSGKPLLGICLGMQLLASAGDEGGPACGLGLVPGRVSHMSATDRSARVPNIGWCDVRPTSPVGPVTNDGCFYFAHSYQLIPDDPTDACAVHDVGGPVVTAVARASVWGVQFHPEKSQDDGLAVLDRFCRAAAAA